MSRSGAHDQALLSAELKLASRLDARFFALLDALQTTGSISRIPAWRAVNSASLW